MENKTISYLNSKAWYRLVKVVFVAAFLIVVLIFNVVVFDAGIAQINYSKTLIVCKIAQTDTKIITLEDSGVYLAPQELARFNYGNFFEKNNYAFRNILGACNKDRIYNFGEVQIKTNGVVNEEDAYRWQAIADEKLANGKNLLDEFPDAAFKWNAARWNNYITYKAHLFDIDPAFTYANFLKLFLIGNPVIVLIFEALRRAFYYIVLGKLRPEK